MKHIEQYPYAEDPGRELENLIDEKDVIDGIQTKLRLGEAYIVRQGDNMFIRGKGGETLFFCNERRMKDLEKGRLFLDDVVAIAKERTKDRPEDPEETRLIIENKQKHTEQ